MKTLRFISTGLFAILLSFTLFSCSDDDDESGYGWKDSKLKTELKSYKWVYNGYDPDLSETQKYTMYFINDTLGVTLFYNKGPYVGVDEEDMTFTYEIQGNVVIVDYDKGSTFEYLYADGVLCDYTYNEIYNHKICDAKDIEYMKKYDPEEIAKKEILKETIRKNLKVTEKFDGNAYVYTFENTLKKIYPTSDIKFAICFYGVCNQYKYCKQSYCDDHKWYGEAEKDGNNYTVTILPIYPEQWGEYELYLNTKKNINQKIQNGEVLTESEKELYKSVSRYLIEMSKTNYDSYPCVVLDGVSYEFEDFRF